MDPVMLRRSTSGLTLTNLWEAALDRLDDVDKQQFDFPQYEKDNALDSIHRDITQRIEDRKRAELVVYHRKGKAVTLRQVLERIVNFIENFKKIGDIIVQYDPAHAALPWAAVRFLLQITVNEQHINNSMIEGMEQVSEAIARFAWIETLYLHASTALRSQLQSAIIKLYTMVLQFLAEARRHFSMRGVQRVLKSIARVDTEVVQAHLQKIAQEEEVVNKLARLIDTQYQQEHAKLVEGGITSLLAKVDGISQQISGFDARFDSNQHHLDTKREQILEWLAATSTHQDYLNAQEAREPGTCEWIFQRLELQKWMASENGTDIAKVLWIHGKPGAGKSILSASLTGHLQENRPDLVASFFCYYGHEKKCHFRGILKSWVSQFVRRSKAALEAAMEIFHEKETNHAEEYEIWQIFREICRRVRGCHFLVDGFDECQRTDKDVRLHSHSDKMEHFLKKLDDAIQNTNARILIVSRFDPVLKEYISTSNGHEQQRVTQRSQYEISKKDTEPDLLAFASNRTNSRLMGRDPELIKQIIDESLNKAEGMFLWIKLAHNRLSRSESPSNLRNIVENLPSGLDQAYERDLRNIVNLELETKDRAIDILRWTLFARRPLKVRELFEALLINLDQPPRVGNEDFAQSSSDEGSISDSSDSDSDDTLDLFPRHLLPSHYERRLVEEKILRPCGSLIELRQSDEDTAIEDHTIHFVHFSVHEFLLKSSMTIFPALSTYKLSDPEVAHDKLSQLCLRYLCYDDFIQKENSSVTKHYEKLQRHAFLHYAGVCWGLHAQECQQRSQAVVQLCNVLLDPANSKWLSYSEVVGGSANRSYETFISRFRDSYPSPLFYASLWGCIETMHFLMNKGEDVNHPGGLYGSPLKAAAAHGHESAVRLLIESGAEVNLEGGMLGTALIAACHRGHAGIVTLLLQHKANVNQDAGWFKQPPIVAACRHNSRKTSEGIVRQLIKAEAKMESVDAYGRTALHCAAAEGKTNVVKYLVRRGADINARDDEGSTPLELATEEGRISTMKFLIEVGANTVPRESQTSVVVED